MEEEKFINRGEAIHIIDSGQVFSIEYYTADKKRGRAGEHKMYSNCVKNTLPTAKTTVVTPELKSAKPLNSPVKYDNSTRRIKLMRTREIKTIHLRLMTRINGKTIL